MVAVITYHALPTTSEPDGKVSQPTTPVVTTPKATAMPVSTVAAAKQPAVPTATPIITPAPLQNDEPEETDISSSDLVLIGTTEEGYPFTYAIYEADLDTVDFEDVVVDTWDGLEVVRNSEGIICRIFGRDATGKARSAKQAVADETVQGFFTEAGLLEKTREGWNKGGNGVAIAQLVDIRIVKIEGEHFCRLVIAGGKKTGSSSNGGSSAPEKPTVTPKPDETEKPSQTPTEKPTQAPTATPRIPDTDIDQGLEDWWQEGDESTVVATPSIGSNSDIDFDIDWGFED